MAKAAADVFERRHRARQPARALAKRLLPAPAI
jgi:hypothetical protein